jgi:hypothetical protein
MPLHKSSSDKAFKANVAELINAGHEQDQAIAIAYKIQRDATGGAPSHETVTERDQRVTKAALLARRAANLLKADRAK